MLLLLLFLVRTLFIILVLFRDPLPSLVLSLTHTHARTWVLFYSRHDRHSILHYTTIHSTHQLNVHCAAIGHPIVADRVYGLGGNAAPCGGLDKDAMVEAHPDCASDELQSAIAAATKDMGVCVHAKTISFKHPVTKNQLELTSKAPF